MHFLLIYSAGESKKMDIIAVAQQEQRYQQVFAVDATLHPPQQILVSVSATIQEDPGVVGHCGLLDKCR